MTLRLPSFQLFHDKEFVAEIPLNQFTFVIGRKAGCHLRLIDSSISREHCRILLTEDGNVDVEDLSSTNGTFVNHKRAVRQTLKPSDSIEIGRCTLIFHDLDPSKVEHDIANSNRGKWLGRFRQTSGRSLLSKPRGKYLVLQDDSLVEFDAVSFSMVRQEEKSGEGPSKHEGFLLRIPRLKVIASSDPKDKEVTKFSVSDSSLGKVAKIQLKESAAADFVFAQPEVKGTRFKLPWKHIERIVLPIALVLALVWVGKNLIPSQLEAELERAETHWDEGLAKIAQKYRYADDSVFNQADISSLTASKTGHRASPLSVEEVWKRIDARPDLRNYLLFEVLDEVLSAEDLSWSLDQVLANLSRMQSITERLPSVRKLSVVYKAEMPSIDMAGIRPGNLVFLKESKTEIGPSYAEYKSGLTARMATVSECSAQRKGTGAVKVVSGFTVNAQGGIGSVFVNQARSAQDAALLACVKTKLSEIQLAPPPGGGMSILYTFQFAAPTKIEF